MGLVTREAGSFRAVLGHADLRERRRSPDVGQVARQAQLAAVRPLGNHVGGRLRVGLERAVARFAVDARVLAPLARLDDIGVAQRPSSRLADLTGHSECRKRVETLLDQANLPYRSAGTVFLVSNFRKARTVLCRHGFYPSPISSAALVEPESRCAVQLIERSL